MLKLLFFGRLGDDAGCEQLMLPVEDLATVAQVRDSLAVDYPDLVESLREPQVMVAVNQSLCPWDQGIQDGDEIAFLPPVTGG